MEDLGKEIYICCDNMIYRGVISAKVFTYEKSKKTYYMVTYVDHLGSRRTYEFNKGYMFRTKEEARAYCIKILDEELKRL